MLDLVGPWVTHLENGDHHYTSPRGLDGITLTCMSTALSSLTVHVQEMKAIVTDDYFQFTGEKAWKSPLIPSHSRVKAEVWIQSKT